MIELGLFAIADGSDDVSELGFAVDFVEFGGFNQRIDDRGIVAAGV